MSYCKHCGKEVYPDAVVCIHCGRDLGYGTSANDDGNIGWGVLGFFVPIVGLILYLLWRNERPKNAKMAGKGALINLIVGVGIAVLWIIIAVIAFSSYSVSTAWQTLNILPTIL